MRLQEQNIVYVRNDLYSDVTDLWEENPTPHDSEQLISCFAKTMQQQSISRINQSELNSFVPLEPMSHSYRCDQNKTDGYEEMNHYGDDEQRCHSYNNYLKLPLTIILRKADNKTLEAQRPEIICDEERQEVNATSSQSFGWLNGEEEYDESNCDTDNCFEVDVVSVVSTITWIEEEFEIFEGSDPNYFDNDDMSITTEKGEEDERSTTASFMLHMLSALSSMTSFEEELVDMNISCGELTMEETFKSPFGENDSLDLNNDLSEK